MPTIRQKDTVKKLIENGGKSVSGAMRKAGFSDAYAKNPNKLIESKGWNELMEKYFPDKDIAKAVKGLIKAKTQVRILDRKGKFKNVRNVPDHLAVSKGVEFACKLKGKYAPEEHVITNKLTDEQLDRIIKD